MTKKVMLAIYIILVYGIFSTELILVTDDWPPYYGQNLKNGGFATIIGKEAFEYSGIELKIEYYPWNRVINKSKEGEYIGVFGAYYSNERSQFFYYSNPIITSKTYLNGIKEIKINPLSNDTLKGLRIGITKGYFYSEEFSNYDGVRFVTSYSVLEGLEKLFNGKIDLLTADYRVVKYYYNKLLREDTLYHFEPPIAQEPIYILISKNAPKAKYYINAFNQGLKKLKESGRYGKIIDESDKW